MSQAANLSRIGSNVRVNLDGVRDRIPANLLNQLKADPRGKIIDYKMTDGGGIGVILEFSDGARSWFFGDELTKG